jgi:methionyl-tRNA synthetase
VTRHFADKLSEHGFIEERTTQQLYSPTDGRFLPDRYVVGTCPNCGYDAARGDQCENCTKLLDPTDLLDPRSAISGATDLEVRSSRHLFLLQSKLAGELRDWLGTRQGWPVLATSIAYKWLDEGLRDRSITRDLSWGVPVDRPGFEGKVFYVWFDAPLAYIAATKDWAESDPSGGRDWKSWWYGEAAEDVTYVQFMGKDNVPFHTLTFPGSVLGTREPWTLATFLKALNWLNYYGGKFSTSQGVGIFMSDAIELLPADYWRWYLVANAPESDDSAFTWELFGLTVNKDLADTYGNFVNRVLKLTSNAFGPAVPPATPGPAEEALAGDLAAMVAELDAHFSAMQYRKAAHQLRAIWAAGNGYLDAEAPWKAVKTDPGRAATVLATAVNLIRLFAVLSAPVIPATASTVLDALEATDAERAWPGDDMPAALATLGPGHPFTIPDVLFRKVTDDELDEWRARFGGAALD